MPIYEYECRGCGHQFEFLLLPSTVPACPSCNGNDLARTISLFAVSSDGTRQQALSDGRKRASRVQRDKAHAAAEYERDHQH